MLTIYKIAAIVEQSAHQIILNLLTKEFLFRLKLIKIAGIDMKIVKGNIKTVDHTESYLKPTKLSIKISEMLILLLMYWDNTIRNKNLDSWKKAIKYNQSFKSSLNWIKKRVKRVKWVITTKKYINVIIEIKMNEQVTAKNTARANIEINPYSAE